MNLLKPQEYQNNLEILKEFYKKIWMQTGIYVKNDELLYDIFDNQKHDNENDMIILARISTLGAMYSAKIDNIPDMLNTIKNSTLNFDNILTKYNTKLGNNELQSFISKYIHWHNEVNDIGSSTPIYDQNVCEKLTELYKSKNINFCKLKELINTFIIDYFGTEVKKVTINTIQTSSLPKEISIHRLIDKFLWLTYGLEKIDKKRNDNKKNGKRNDHRFNKNEKNILKLHDNQHQNFINSFN